MPRRRSNSLAKKVADLAKKVNELSIRRRSQSASKGRSRSRSASKGRSRHSSPIALVVRLSGGPHRQRFKGGKKGAEKVIRAAVQCRKVIFVDGTKQADVIVVPDEVDTASKTASKSGGRAMTLSCFLDTYECHK